MTIFLFCGGRNTIICPLINNQFQDFGSMTENNQEKIDVEYVAHLARLYLTEDEIATFQGQLDGIVGYVQQIGTLNLDGIEPTSHAVPDNNVFREDIARPGLEHDVVMDNAPRKKDGQFVVPQIIE